MNKFIILLLVFFSTFCCAYEHTLSICAIFRDDAEYLKEWIDFHHKQGVEHFYLYDNFSIDNPQDELKDYIQKNIVTLIPYPVPHNTDIEWHWVQCNCYMQCIRSYGHLSKWIAFIDTDEFLFAYSEKLPDFLKKYERCAGVIVNWKCYGTSNIYKFPKGEMLENLTYRVGDNHESGKSMKSIIQPTYISGCESMHSFIFKNGFYSVNENFQREDGPVAKTCSINKIRINHYLFRDKDFMMNKKVKRMIQQGRDPSQFVKQEPIFNEVYDPCINMVAI